MAKRFAQHATTRNALKRVVREAFRACRLSLPPADYVVRLNRRIEAIGLSALKRAARQEVDAHFVKASQ
jgi:ribonuclease P protein component